MDPVRPAPLRRRAQAVLHVLGVAAGWALFAWMWWIVFQQSRRADDFWWLLLAAFVVVPVITGFWVLHNKGIYRRLGPRRSVRDVVESYARDFHERKVDADWTALASARFVLIELIGPTKRYRSAAADTINEPGAPNA